MAVTFNTTTEKIWSALVSKGLSKQGAAGVLGNIYAESNCYPKRLQGDFSSGYVKSQSYTKDVDAKTISEYNFVHNGPGGGGYGLCQWTYYTRKQNLYDRTVKVGKSIGSLEAQVDFLIHELKTGYPNVWNTVKAGANKTVQECSDAMLLDFERPAQKESKRSQRGGYSQEYYDNYKSLAIRNDFSEDEVNNLTSLLSIALSQEGTTEYPSGSNKVKYNTWYYGKVVSGDAYPWCMVFVQWCCNQAGISIYKTASCSDLLKHTAEDTFVERDNLSAGDLIFFTKSQSIASAWRKKEANHVGIVVSNNGDGTITTIEGNTGQASQWNGGAVKQSKRYLNKESLNSGGGIIGGVRLVATNLVGGTTPVESRAEQCSWIQQTLSNMKEKLQRLFDNTVDYWAQYKLGSSIKSKQYEYKEFTTKIEKDTIVSVNQDANVKRTKGTGLLTTPTLVESPFILLTVGDYTFGSYRADGKISKAAYASKGINVEYPNYMTSIDVVKINGVVNQYTIQMVYQIQAGQDPNLIDKIFSTVGYGTVYISYGDWNSPAFIYKREEAIITNLTSNVDFTNSRITYTLKCTSNSLALIGGYYNFSAQQAKPSDVLYNMLYNKNSTYKLLDSFPGMKNQTLVKSKGLIRSDDSVVKIEAQSGMDALSYINYLVSCMGDSNKSGLRKSNYYLTICDDTTGEFGGPYFKITKVSSDTNTISLDNSNTYEVDVGYPGDTLVTKFNIDTDNSWSLLYNYSQAIIPDLYTYRIDDEGKVVQTSSPNIITSSRYGRATETQRNWWTQMTQFPITATLEIKGLVRPALLMTYLRINALFYGQRHISSGLYIITRQQDRIDSRGYRTTLSLTRIAGDLDTVQRKTVDVTVKLPVQTKLTKKEKKTWNRWDVPEGVDISRESIQESLEAQNEFKTINENKNQRVSSGNDNSYNDSYNV